MLDPNIKKYLSNKGKKGGLSTAKKHPGKAREWGRLGGLAKGVAGATKKRQLSTPEENNA